MRQILESKNNEISNITQELREIQDNHRSEKRELEETLRKDKFNQDVNTLENEKLKKANQDFE
jgi:hypothetical protein